MMNKNDLLFHLEYTTEALRTDRIKDAFKKIDRVNFVPDDYKIEAYEDYPLPIGYGGTISQPTTVAFMLELLDPQKGEKILDVGSGSGWTTALLAHIVGEKGEVTGVEIVPELVAFGQKNIEKYHFSHASIVQVKENIVGFSDKAPFDKILVSAAAEKIPQELVDQLKTGGSMVIPIQDTIWHVHKKKDGTIEHTEYPGFAFVPLINRRS